MIETLLIPLVIGAAGYYFGWSYGKSSGLSEGYYDAMSWWASKLYSAAKEDGKVEIEFHFVHKEPEEDYE